MFWVTAYGVIGIIIAVVVSVLADLSNARSGTTILLSALVWPLIVLGAVQMGLWALASELGRHAAAGSSAPMLISLDLPPL